MLLNVCRLLITSILSQWRISLVESLSVTVECESRNFQPKVCPVPNTGGGVVVVSVDVADQQSTTLCELDVRFGYTDTEIWVDRGCRAEFLVHIAPEISSTSSLLMSSWPVDVGSLSVVAVGTTTITTSSNVYSILSDTQVDSEVISTIDGSQDTTFDSSPSISATVAIKDSSWGTIFISLSSDVWSTTLLKNGATTDIHLSHTSDMLEPSSSRALVALTSIDSTTTSFIQSTTERSFILTSLPEDFATSLPENLSTSLLEGLSMSLPEELNTSFEVVTSNTVKSTSQSICCCMKATRYIDDKHYIKQIVKKLRVNVKNLSQTMRRRTSVYDSRPSSVGMGFTGIVFLVGTGFCILMADLLSFFHEHVGQRRLRRRQL